ncbi:glutamyl-tRNA reductase [Streptomyces sp. 71268]|uniref:glutamyl-tRNA reductase n=1 Tax=Streptomyces sp. 71268 TaxID=3002640 RepID=UPI0023F9318E|nr:glutamyl-tRNA reductase [Streptomyces sp. 71268]WEV26181.1 glutamyl-tRNA reductase [Streptomyces sp. 71268]
MSLLVVGLSHRSAPVSALERAALQGEQRAKLAQDALVAEPAVEAAVLSTCNRVELYADVDKFHAGVAELSTLLARHTGVPLDELTPYLYVHYEDRAVHHLFTVACGLDSMVVGEGQILAQIKDALALGQELHTAGRLLNDLFQQALRVGKRAHSETGIDKAGQSLVTFGLEQLAGDASVEHWAAGKRALVIGAGSMSSLAATTLARAGVAEVAVANRTLERAQRLATSLTEQARGHGMDLANGSVNGRDNDLPGVGAEAPSTGHGSAFGPAATGVAGLVAVPDQPHHACVAGVPTPDGACAARPADADEAGAVAPARGAWRAGLVARAVPMSEVAAELAAADIVVSCTGATGLVLDAEALRAAVAQRPDRPLALLDLAMPRDIDAAAHRLDGVRLVDIESLAEASADAPMAADVDQVRAIVSAEVTAFGAAQRAAHITPTVVALRTMAASVVASEISRLDGRLPDLDDKQRAEITQTVRRVVDKLLHAPTVRVKQLAATPGGAGYADALRELFDLDPEAVAAVSRADGNHPKRGRA